MAAEYSSDALQTIQPGSYAVFTTTVVPCEMGLIQHSDGTPIFSLSGWRPNNSGYCCKRNKPTLYDTTLNMNVALSAGQTASQLSVALAVDGVVLSISQMDSYPAAAEQFNHIGTEISLPILRGCCQTVAVQNTSTVPIDIKNMTIKFDRPDLTNR